MKRFRKSVTALIGFDRRERRGTFILALILVVLLLVRLFAMRPGEVPAVLPPLPGVAEELSASDDGQAMPERLFIFDPNTVSYDSLLSLGLSARQARTLVNYRASGARFRRPEDLLRVYGIDSATAAKLIPYVNVKEGPGRKTAGIQRKKYVRDPTGGFEETANEKTRDDRGGHSGNFLAAAETNAEIGPVDLNLCTATELESLPGIGPVLADRIIRYRTLLGGFVDTGQLAEVYGLDSSVARLAAGRLTLTFDLVRPIVLDSVGFSDLARHPYIGYETARLITRYRSLAGPPVTLGKMVGSGVITTVQAGRIAPYVRPARGVSGIDYEFISSKVLK